MTKADHRCLHNPRRGANPEQVYGDFAVLDKKNLAVFAYTREHNGNKALVLLNFSDDAQKFKMPSEAGSLVAKAKLLISNYASDEGIELTDEVELKPWESRVYL